MTMIQYWKNFTNLLKYMPQYQRDKWFRIQKFIMGLIPHIEAKVDMHKPQTMNEVFQKATKQEQKFQRLSNLHSNSSSKSRYGKNKFHKGGKSHQIHNLKRGSELQEKGEDGNGGKRKKENKGKGKDDHKKKGFREDKPGGCKGP